MLACESKYQMSVILRKCTNQYIGEDIESTVYIAELKGIILAFRIWPQEYYHLYG
jgi:hypothetical protein